MRGHLDVTKWDFLSEKDSSVVVNDISDVVEDEIDCDLRMKYDDNVEINNEKKKNVLIRASGCGSGSSGNANGSGNGNGNINNSDSSSSGSYSVGVSGASGSCDHSEINASLTWQREAMTVSLSVHYKLFLEVFEVEKSKELQRNERVLVGEREKEREGVSEGEGERMRETEEGSMDCKKKHDEEEEGKDEVNENVELRREVKEEEDVKFEVEVEEKIKISRKEKKTKKKHHIIVDENLKIKKNGKLFFQPQSLYDQLSYLSTHNFTDFEKNPKLRKLLRKALKVIFCYFFSFFFFLFVIIQVNITQRLFIYFYLF